MKKNPISNSYYWRAVRRIAERKGISIQKARKLDWQKEVNAERKRRSKAHVHPGPSKRISKTKTVPSKLSSKTRRLKEYPTRKSVPVARKPVSKVPTRHYQRELKIKEYDRIREIDQEEFEETEDWQEEWETDYQDDFEELDEMDDLDDFLEDIDSIDEDVYKEPS